jgi:adenylate cyclase
VGKTTDQLPSGYFSNKVVFIGSRILTKTQGERKDEYPSPYSHWIFEDATMFMPGVEVQATEFVNLLRRQWFTQLSSTQELLLMLIIGLSASIGLIKMRPFWATVTAFSAVVLVALLNYILVSEFGYWFSWLIIVVQILVALAWSTIYNSITLYVQKRLMQQSLSMYVSPGQVKQIMKQPDILKPGAAKQQLSILFSDIAGFTTMSEGMDSDDLAKLMNNYFEAAVGKCIHKTEGTVVKFIGDAIFAIWNAPEKQEDHADRACRGAILLRDQIGDFIGGKGKAIRTRIGLHMGDANVGNFGSSTRIDYTAIGENINLASRMEGLNKYMGTDILITGDVKGAVGDRFITRLCGLVRLKGFEKKAVAVHELINFPEKSEDTRVWREAYAAAWEQFKNKNFAAAKEGFQKVLGMKPNDGPSQFHLNFLEEVKLDELPENWQGEIEMHEK